MSRLAVVAEDSATSTSVVGNNSGSSELFSGFQYFMQRTMPSRPLEIVPLVYQIAYIPDRAILVTQPFPIMLMPDTDGILVTSPITDIFEAGETQEEAIANFLSALSEHFRWLTSEEGALSPSIRAELLSMRRYLTMIAR